MYLLADTADTERKKEQKQDNQNESKFCSRGVARYYHRYDWDHSRKVSTIRSTMALRGTILAAPSKVHFLYASLHYTLVGRK
jgi:hypothetical protein